MGALTAKGNRLFEAARELAPRILALREEIEQQRRMPPSLAETLRAAGFFELWLPEAFGGPALPAEDFLSIVEELARADGATGWCVTIGAVYSLLAGSLTETTSRELFADRAIVAGSINPTGKAVVVDGGYRVSGRWSWGSGITHSQWTLGNCIVHDEGGMRRMPGGAPEMKFVFFPTADVEIIDAWRVGGMRGTGSYDYVVEGLFAPTARAMPAFANLGLQPGTLYRMPLLSLFCFALAAVVLGIARAAIGAFVEIALAKVPMGSPAKLREKPSAQSDVARAEALVRASRAFLLEAIGELWDEVAAGDPPSLARRAGVRLATTHAGEACLRAIELVYNAAGGSAIHDSGRLDRCLRDARVAVQHIGLTTNTYELAGKVLLGMDPGTPRF